MNRRTFLNAVFLASVISLAGLTGCFGAPTGDNGNTNSDSGSNSNSYQQVDTEAAKELMDTEDDYVILDLARRPSTTKDTSPEPSSSRTTPWRPPPRTHCPTRANSSWCTAAAAIAAREASQALVDLGYTNVVEFGGINSWPYEVEK